jgi:folate-dependent tRNA-U54 methylase TrmFO/GidA
VEQPVVIPFTGVKVFSTTLARDRDALSDRITQWIRDNPQLEVVDKNVTQSSDNEFHCLTIIFFFRERPR